MSTSRLRLSYAAVTCLAAFGTHCLAAGTNGGQSGNPSGGADASGEDAGASSGSDAGPAPDAGSTTGLDAGGDGSADAPSKPSSGAYDIDLSQTSVSGFSSGGFFAVQFHVIFSSIMQGAAVFAGGPYDCAQGSATAAETTCLTGSPDVTALVAVTKKNFAAGSIDDPSNLSSQHVFLFGGADDSVVDPKILDALDSYYEAFMSASSIQYESRHPGTTHTMPTLSYGSACSSLSTPYVGKCSYDGAGLALEQIYGSLNAPATTLSGKTLSFSQAPFAPSAATQGLAATGYYYVPSSCASGEKCRIHVSFHGCQQDATLVKDAYYGHAGYNEWADTNHIIVLYPQATTSAGNDYGCWDFWGYDGASYATKTGVQAAAVRSMIDWLAAGGGTDGGSADSGASPLSDSGSPPPPGDAGSACIAATNTAQVAAGRAYAAFGSAFAKGSSEYLGPDTASAISSIKAIAPSYYVLCL